MKKLTKNGFSLIETLVVVLIIGILTAVALPQYQKAVAKSRAAKAVSLLKDILTAQQIYHTTYNRYATDLSELDIQVSFPTGFEIIVQEDYRLIVQSSEPYYTLNLLYEQGRCYCFTGKQHPFAISICKSFGAEVYGHDEDAERYYVF